MRLSDQELTTIRKELREADSNGKIFLFGSRTDDTRKGGDIDIFFETSVPMDLKSQLLLQYKISHLCETKVDMIIKAWQQPEKSIYAIARQGLRL